MAKLLLQLSLTDSVNYMLWAKLRSSSIEWCQLIAALLHFSTLHGRNKMGGRANKIFIKMSASSLESQLAQQDHLRCFTLYYDSLMFVVCGRILYVFHLISSLCSAICYLRLKNRALREKLCMLPDGITTLRKDLKQQEL